MSPRRVLYAWDHQCEVCLRVHVPEPCCTGCPCQTAAPIWTVVRKGRAGAFQRVVYEGVVEKRARTVYDAHKARMRQGWLWLRRDGIEVDHEWAPTLRRIW